MSKVLALQQNFEGDIFLTFFIAIASLHYKSTWEPDELLR